jgi:hypothetical protein
MTLIWIMWIIFGVMALITTFGAMGPYLLYGDKQSARVQGIGTKLFWFGFCGSLLAMGSIVVLIVTRQDNPSRTNNNKPLSINE